MNETIVNEVAVDYVTATSFSGKSYRKIVGRILGTMTDSPKQAKTMQYEGDRIGGLFHGEAMQKGKVHYMISISGSEADRHIQTMVKSDLRFTRLDIQITIELPEWYRAREYSDFLNRSVWRGRGREARLLEGGGGNDTVYIGAASSERMVRVYVKNEDYLRFEVQFRGKLARNARQRMVKGGDKEAGAILRGEILKLPDNPLHGEFLAFCGTRASEVKGYRIRPDAMKRMRWLRGLLPTIKRMSNDHDYGDIVKMWMEEIIDDKTS